MSGFCVFANFLQRSVLLAEREFRAAGKERCERGHVCKPLTPDVVAPKALQNNHSYVSSVDLPLDSLLKNIAWWVVTWSTLKLSKFGGGHFPGTIQYLWLHPS